MFRMWTVSTDSGQYPVAGSCEDDKEPLGFTKGGEFLY
jgi:hypothetical protein